MFYRFFATTSVVHTVCSYFRLKFLQRSFNECVESFFCDILWINFCYCKHEDTLRYNYYT